MSLQKLDGEREREALLFERKIRTLVVNTMILSMWLAGLFGLWHRWTAP